MRKEGESKWAGDGREEKEDNGLEHLLTHPSRCGHANNDISN